MKPEDLLYAINDLDDDLIQGEEATPAARKFRGRRLATLLIAAVVASTMILTAFASSDGSLWFQNFFSKNVQQPLSSSQNAYINTHTVQGNQSQTVNGYTITLESAISDGNRTFIQCKLTAPEGTVLDADKYGDIHDTVFVFQEPGNAPSIGSFGWENLDDDPSDNTAILLFHHEIAYSGSEASSFTDHPCQLLIYGLQGTYYEGEGIDMTIREEKLTEGFWSFDIVFPEDSDREIEFVTGYVECPCEVQMGMKRTGENSLMPILEPAYVQVTSLTLRALSADFHYKYAEKDQVNADFEDLYVVMNDGTKVRMQRGAGAPNYNGYKFDTPIILEDVDHILLPDGTKLTVPLAP